MDAATEDDRILAARLRATGNRLTGARRAVWSALGGGGSDAGTGAGTGTGTGAGAATGAGTHGGPHLSVDEVVERTHAQGTGVDRATAYRALALLEELGLVRSSQLGAGGAVRWERAHPDEHFHLRCTGCGTVDHHVGTLVATVREHLATGHGFLADDVELTVHGRCATCRAGDDGAGR
jgi:Fur family ferric uptake transcriptional regulator